MTATFETARQLAQRTVVDPRYPINTYTLDPLWVLYDRILRIDSADPDDPNRDRFYLSKGHGPGSYYAVLAAKGFIPADWLDSVAATESPLGAHPDTTRVPGVEISAGSLGHGLPLGIGTALGLTAQGIHAPRVYVLIGDAELDEGSNHEAMAFAGAYGLGNLTTLVVDNHSATHGWPGGIASRFTAQGWTATTVGITDHDGLASALTRHTKAAPHAVIATVED
ncbi:transketolase [Stackebrandtia nassauensis]|uniref:Transketolase domain protein n=1 Tax=Stackebrandtia nassauensis (strain DSM 44728 / CIP 108903 / NRRL B-16338 / NBRC 102104 / LLR-40K-21) TaxID=446470 RepID=D3Q492_STANL|nr:transketolase [Stackebrandtia nassauensis]ADD45977.1 Transketolase domain protein [Stackebrandtia nassauensis DSM 44728]